MMETVQERLPLGSPVRVNTDSPSGEMFSGFVRGWTSNKRGILVGYWIGASAKADETTWWPAEKVSPR